MTFKQAFINLVLAIKDRGKSISSKWEALTKYLFSHLINVIHNKYIDKWTTPSQPRNKKKHSKLYFYEASNSLSQRGIKTPMGFMTTNRDLKTTKRKTWRYKTQLSYFETLTVLLPLFRPPYYFTPKKLIQTDSIVFFCDSDYSILKKIG
jgi:hypothetical protein